VKHLSSYLQKQMKTTGKEHSKSFFFKNWFCAPSGSSSGVLQLGLLIKGKEHSLSMLLVREKIIYREISFYVQPADSSTVKEYSKSHQLFELP
jgi:hypothetical protein